MEHYLLTQKVGDFGVQYVLTVCNNGDLLTYTNESKWEKCHKWTEDYIREHGEKISRYSLKSSGITPPVRDFQDLDWEWDDERAEYHAVAFVQGQVVDLIIFPNGAGWSLHYDNKDPSELIERGELYQLQDKAQSLHEESIISSFFE
ncbi:hypothetical protein CHUUTOTORO_02620 [Serratia phage vB_SmaM-ChuuTotoro]|nr:hypothetical protein CHUUTOTORO_02620 [Serratia phage vB_SmaM-ChuuTotoro]